MAYRSNGGDAPRGESPGDGGGESSPGLGPDVDHAALRLVLEGEIIPRLLLAHGHDRRNGVTRLSSTDVPDVDAFANLTLNADVDVLVELLEAAIHEGLSAEDLFTRLIGPTARRLGVYWEQDICTFADVTIGLGKLHQIVHRLSLGSPYPIDTKGSHSVLLSPYPGETHTLGLAMVAEAFRDQRWIVTEEWNVTERRLIEHLRGTRYDVIGLTLSAEAALADAPRLIQALRRASLNHALVVMVGGWMFSAQPGLAQRCGADATADNGRNAAKKAAELLDAHAARV